MHLPEAGYTVRADDAKGNNATCKKLKKTTKPCGVYPAEIKIFCRCLHVVPHHWLLWASNLIIKNQNTCAQGIRDDAFQTRFEGKALDEVKTYFLPKVEAPGAEMWASRVYNA